MAHFVFRPTTLDWQPGGHPLERKKIGPDPRVLLLEFLPGFEDPNWCSRSHVLSVHSGTLTVDFEKESVEVGPGESLRVETGTSHRAANRGPDPVILQAVSELQFPGVD